MKCRRWISANSQEIISERAAFHYWRSGKSKEIKQMVYFSKISGEVGAVLCRGWLRMWDLSRDFYLLVQQHLHSARLAGLMLEWVLFLWYLGLKRLQVLHEGCVWLLGSTESAQHSAFPMTAAATGATPREPGGLCPVPEQCWRWALGWVSRDGELWDQWS